MPWLKPLLICLTAPLLLTACVTASSSPALRTITVRRPVCPVLKTYPSDAQSRVAEALDHMARDNPVAGMIVDYGQLRAALRAACRNTGT